MTESDVSPLASSALDLPGGNLQHKLACVHCGESLSRSKIQSGFAVRQVSDPERAPAWVCCVGCLAAMNFSVSENCRWEILPTQSKMSLDVLPAPAPRSNVKQPAGYTPGYTQWDRSEILAHAQRTSAGGYLLNLAVDAIHCPNCAWLIELSLQKISSELRVRVDVPHRCLELEFNPERIPLSTIAASMAEIGYPARLIDGMAEHRTDKTVLKQIFVAGMCAVQAMMFAEPLYWSNSDLPPQTAQFFAWLSALLTLPAVAYAGARFFIGARNELRLRRPAMDSLISLSILLAFVGSGIGLMRGSQQVYFDAIAMFVFLLLLGRLLESSLLKKARFAALRLQDCMPAMATLASGEVRALSDLRVGDCLRATQGEVLIADGVLQSAHCRLSVAVFDGEATPQQLTQGAKVYAGASVQSADCVYQVTALGAATELAQIARASQQTACARAPSSEQTAQLATRFSLVVIVLAIITSMLWWIVAPERALAVSLSVLTVACPCALGLALPLARAMAHARLQALGVILLKPDALDRVELVDCVMFDKTGTLTEIDQHTLQVSTEGAITTAEALGIARALELGSTHPIAQPLRTAALEVNSPDYRSSEIEQVPGLGLRGIVNGTRWRLGAPALSGELDSGCVLLSGPEASARFSFGERLQVGAADVVSELTNIGVATQLVSGDSEARVQAVAERLKIESYYHRCTPAAKCALAQSHQAAGRFALMLGDGVNDAIALAGAHVAVSFGSANALARTHADVLLLRNDLRLIPEMIRTARMSVRIARQNLLWARGYNLVAIPLAMFGLIGPGWAAIGMAASSLFVSLNAARLWPRGATVSAQGALAQPTSVSSSARQTTGAAL
jgi:P-type Cu2+ transporter